MNDLSKLPPGCEPLRADLCGRGKYALALVALLVLTFAVQFRSVPLIARENRALRVWVTPTYAAHSLNRFVRETYLESEAIEVVGQDTVIDRAMPWLANWPGRTSSH